MADYTCHGSLDEHLDRLIAGLYKQGLNGCEGTYHALLELAEFLRMLHKYAPYTPRQTNQLVLRTMKALHLA